MPLSDEDLAWVTLARTPGLDRASLEAALSRFGSAGALIGAADGARARAGVPAAARHYLRAPEPLAPAERAWLERGRHHVVPFTRYPPPLRDLAHGPIALYAAGRLEALDEPQLAVVGSRRPTAQGLDTAFEFAQGLAERGLAVTSGLAQGIDAAAHRGALRARGTTLAVLGSGIDVVYPEEHRTLSECIERDGLLISEFPPGTAPRRNHFPRRNRIIAGLAMGTLVVEAAHGSGSLITARAAARLGRKVFAVPGSIENPLSRGCHELIRRGATLAESANDILSELNISAFSPRRSAPAAGAAAHESGPAGMDKAHKILLDALGFDPAGLDVLVVRTGFKPEAVSSMMLILELEGHVQAAPGGRYSRVANRRAGGER